MGSVSGPAAPPPLNYRYGDHPSQFVRLHLPAGGAELPVVLVIHGGFWRQSYGLEYADPLCRNLIEFGVAAAAVEYRRVGRSSDDPERAEPAGGGWPMTLIDICTAVDSLDSMGQASAGGRLDWSRVVALGHSAGGHLAGWLAHRSSLPTGVPGAVGPGAVGPGAVGPGAVGPGAHWVPILGAACQAPVMDLVTAAEQRIGGRAVVDLLGGSPDSAPQRYCHASPIGYVGDGARIALVHGTDDDEVPIDQSRRYAAAATAAGDPVELTEIAGAGHYQLIDPGHRTWEICRQRVLRML